MSRTRKPVADFYLSDTDIAAKLSMSPQEWTATATVLERSGLPPRDPLFKGKRCWPAVSEFLINRAKGAQLASPTSGGEFDGYKGFGSGISGPKKKSESIRRTSVLGG